MWKRGGVKTQGGIERKRRDLISKRNRSFGKGNGGALGGKRGEEKKVWERGKVT